MPRLSSLLRTLLLCTMLGTLLSACEGGNTNSPPSGTPDPNPQPGGGTPGGNDPDDEHPAEPGKESPVPSIDDLALPDSHPRLWFTSAEDLDKARAWYAAAQPDVRDLPGHDNGNANIALNLCLDYLMTGNPEHGDAAIGWLMDFELANIAAISNDHARWFMESAILIYDWCHDRMSSDQRKNRVAYFNEALLMLHDKPWGHDPMPANNYFQGYLRNAIEWVIASADENPKAAELWDKYVGHRLRDVLLPFHEYGGGRGGTPGEGGQYGVYMIDYSLIPYASLREFDATGGSLDIFERTAFFRENFFYVLHAMLPGITHMPWYDGEGNATVISRYQLFPFGDDEKFRNQDLARFYADVFQVYTILWPDTAVGRYARHALRYSGGEPKRYFQALDDPGHAGAEWHALPLDYFAAGSGHFLARNAWQHEDRDLMVMHFQGGQVEGVGHYHGDAMNLQLWRGNREDGGWFLTRETTAYGDCLAGFENKRGDGVTTLFHNGVSFEGMGQLYWNADGGPRLVHDTGNRYDRGDLPDGLPVVERLISDPHFAYVTGDYTRAYRAANGENPPRYDRLPFVETVRREVVFVREFDAIVVLDRLDVSDWQKPVEEGETELVLAADIRKTVNWHFGVEPVDNNGVFSASYGAGANAQHFVIRTLTGAAFNVVDERDWPAPAPGEPRGCDDQPPNVGQYRLEVTPVSEANGRSDVVTVLHAANDEAAAAALDIEFQDDATNFVVRLDHPERGRVELRLPKDPTGEGVLRLWNAGSEGEAADREFSLADRREYMYVGDEGPVWTTVDTGTVASSGKVLVGGYDDRGQLVLEQRVPESSFEQVEYRVPVDVTRHRVLRLRPGRYRVEAAVTGGMFEVTLARGEGNVEVGNDFALEFTLGAGGDVVATSPDGN